MVPLLPLTVLWGQETARFARLPGRQKLPPPDPWRMQWEDAGGTAVDCTPPGSPSDPLLGLSPADPAPFQPCRQLSPLADPDPGRLVLCPCTSTGSGEGPFVITHVGLTLAQACLATGLPWGLGWERRGPKCGRKKCLECGHRASSTLSARGPHAGSAGAAAEPRAPSFPICRQE